jgi:hypothetical protein
MLETANAPAAEQSCGGAVMAVAASRVRAAAVPRQPFGFLGDEIELPGLGVICGRRWMRRWLGSLSSSRVARLIRWGRCARFWKVCSR